MFHFISSSATLAVPGQFSVRHLVFGFMTEVSSLRVIGVPCQRSVLL